MDNPALKPVVSIDADGGVSSLKTIKTKPAAFVPAWILRQGIDVKTFGRYVRLAWCSYQGVIEGRSMASVANQAWISRRTLDRWLADLEGKGLIARRFFLDVNADRDSTIGIEEALNRASRSTVHFKRSKLGLDQAFVPIAVALRHLSDSSLLTLAMHALFSQPGIDNDNRVVHGKPREMYRLAAMSKCHWQKNRKRLVELGLMSRSGKHWMVQSALITHELLPTIHQPIEDDDFDYPDDEIALLTTAEIEAQKGASDDAPLRTSFIHACARAREPGLGRRILPFAEPVTSARDRLQKSVEDSLFLSGGKSGKAWIPEPPGRKKRVVGRARIDPQRGFSISGVNMAGTTPRRLEAITEPRTPSPAEKRKETILLHAMMIDPERDAGAEWPAYRESQMSDLYDEWNASGGSRISDEETALDSFLDAMEREADSDSDYLDLLPRRVTMSFKGHASSSGRLGAKR